MGSDGTADVPILSLPDAIESLDALTAEIVRSGRQAAFFLDFDGTLAPIVDKPEKAQMLPETAVVMRELARFYPIAMVSGRCLEDLKNFMGMPGIVYAGSHGCHIHIPQQSELKIGMEARPQLEKVLVVVNQAIQMAPGAVIEDNLMCVSVHYRHVRNPKQLQVLQEVIEKEVAKHELRLTHGKMVWEIRHNEDWHKGKAVEYLLEQLGLDSERFIPICIGDDKTDEDAFNAIAPHRGLSVVVFEEGGMKGDVNRGTAASLRLKTPVEVCSFLNHFVKTESLRTIGANAMLGLPVAFGDGAMNNGPGVDVGAAP